jgi:outer membrane protein OmpA-like peptidoglycan-associated protein
MKTRFGLAALAFVTGSAGAVAAQDNNMSYQPGRPDHGAYVGVLGGLNLLEDSEPSGPLGGYKIEADPGWAAGVRGGYQMGRFRVELEATFRKNTVDTFQNLSNPTPGLPAPGGKVDGNGVIWSVATMLNGIYDIPTNWRITPYVGGGVGAVYLRHEDVGNGTVRVANDDDWAFAWQALAGFQYEIDPRLTASIDYRYFRAVDAKIGDDTDTKYRNHTVMVGLTYRLAPPPPPPPPPPAPVAEAPQPPPPAQPELARSYLVFFDWNSAQVTPEGANIIREAATNAKTLNVTRLEVTGHADRSGSPAYNQKLSLRRAQAVKNALVQLGVPDNEISVVGKGESAPLVPTADGVREPQNRRVEIVLP